MAFGKRKRSRQETEMNETTHTDGSEELEAAEGAGEGAATGPEDELEALRSERDEFEQKWLRAQADFQNLRRRMGAEIDAAVARAKSDVLTEAVTVLDYLDMALAAPVTTEEAKNLKIGVEMTRGQLQALFDRLGVTPIDATGSFDPALHQAVATVETDELEPGAIVDVVRGGYRMGETVLRYAQVRVAAAPDGAGTEDHTAAAADGAAGDDDGAPERGEG